MQKESVWDYPRPPRLEPCSKLIEVIFAGVQIAQTTQSFRVLETSHPPVYYIPQGNIVMSCLKLAPGASFCEWKGTASYWDLEVNGKLVRKVAWSYAAPTPPFTRIKDHLAFYADKMESCTVDGELVRPQPGNFYGGWITDNLVGPFKGEAGSGGW
jgi:uncharacterized protein (DUF427 family)